MAIKAGFLAIFWLHTVRIGTGSRQAGNNSRVTTLEEKRGAWVWNVTQNDVILVLSSSTTTITITVLGKDVILSKPLNRGSSKMDSLAGKLAAWNLAIENGFCHSPVDFRAYSRAYPRLLPRLSALTPAPIRAYPRLLPHTPAHADAQILTREWQKPRKLYVSQSSQRSRITNTWLVLLLKSCSHAVMEYTCCVALPKLK